MENLSKENTWNDIKQNYRVAFDNFQEWLNNYKEENDWDELFKNQFFRASKENQVSFYDIPLDMQIGILMRFFNENLIFPVGNLSQYADTEYVSSAVVTYFIVLDSQLTDELKQLIIENN